MADLTTDRLSDSFLIGRASRYAAPEFEDQSLPVIYGDLTTPSRENAGVYALPKIDATGEGVYCVAGHEISGAVILFDDDGRIEPDDYALELARNYQGKGVIATAVFSAPPKGRVTAVCKGKMDAAGALIENPAEVIYDLMTSVWGFSEQDIDMQALSRAAAGASALGYRAGGYSWTIMRPPTSSPRFWVIFSGDTKSTRSVAWECASPGRNLPGFFPKRFCPASASGASRRRWRATRSSTRFRRSTRGTT